MLVCFAGMQRCLCAYVPEANCSVARATGQGPGGNHHMVTTVCHKGWVVGVERSALIPLYLPSGLKRTAITASV